MKNLDMVMAAIQYIENHFLREKIDLDDVSNALHYSKYHLNRTFSATVGLTINEYAIRRKLTEAAKMLVFSDRPIIDIAIIVGYKSQQSFSNAFKAMYKYAPRKFRKNEVFYPLQLKYDFKNNRDMIWSGEKNCNRNIKYAKKDDIDSWMRLVHLAIDGFPYLDEREHETTLKNYIDNRSAFIMTEKEIVIGAMMINRERGSIDFLGVHPLYRNKDVSKDFLNIALRELLKDVQISTTTFREGDKADTGYRKELKKLGFVEDELLMEFGYPTQKMVFKEKKDCDFHDEVEHLKYIWDKIEFMEKEAQDSVDKTNKNYKDTKDYMVKYRGEIDPNEMFQNHLILSQIDRQGNFEVRFREKLSMMKDSPYFARIDFKGKGEPEEAFYIGKFALADDGDLLISDWRSPIAGIFYDYEIGKCQYEAPLGIIQGELTRKRQFKIKAGKLEYAFESSLNIQDVVLQKELSSRSDSKMKSIISTIQREQNKIIRNEKDDTLIIQGVAGSGKTSVALHRIAFLLYKFKDTLSSANVAIISPNRVFGDYISNVLPELGEEPIFQLSLYDIAEIQFDKEIDFEADHDYFDRMDSKLKERIRWKSTLDFAEMIEKYIISSGQNIFSLPDKVEFSDFHVAGEWINERNASYRKHSLEGRINMIAEDISNFIETINIRGESSPSVKAISKKLRSFLKVKTPLELYKKFYREMKFNDKFLLKSSKTLEWNDVYPFIHFHIFFKGAKDFQRIKHLLVDEMQDYTAVQYSALNKLFNCKKTILGDFGQFINPNHGNSLEDLKNIYEGSEFVEMNKSYRSTYEIISFAKRIKNVNSIEAIERHGEEADIIKCCDVGIEISEVEKKIKKFKSGENSNLGIILKTDEMALSFYETLKESSEISLISEKSKNFSEGVSILSVKMAKGLEFDEVIIPMATKENYFTPYHSGLLYIACTRAMHKLTLTYTGNLTELIK